MLVSLLHDDISQTNADDKESYFDVSSSLYFWRLAQHSMTTKALKSVPLSVSSKKRSCRTTRRLVSLICSILTFVFFLAGFELLCFTCRDQGLHKLVFEREGLPDGTELGYYARGQVSYLILRVVIYISGPDLLLRHNITVGRNCSEATKWVLEFTVTAASVRYLILYTLHHDSCIANSFLILHFSCRWAHPSSKLMQAGHLAENRTNFLLLSLLYWNFAFLWCLISLYFLQLFLHIYI